jgi:hypothetical protein
MLNSSAKRNRAHGATLQAGQTVAYTKLFLHSLCDISHTSGSRRGSVLGPAMMDAETGHTTAPITTTTWLIEVRRSNGEIGRINPANVCRTRSVSFIEIS